MHPWSAIWTVASACRGGQVVRGGDVLGPYPVYARLMPGQTP